MASKTSIEWAGFSWNPIVGCSVHTPGCKRCYAMIMAARIERMGTAPHYAGTTMLTKAGPVWTGKMAQAPDNILFEPLRRQKTTTWFVNSMSDLFHEAVPDEWIDRVFAVMALTPQHTYQVLTKRSDRMRAYLTDQAAPRRVYDLLCEMVLAMEIQVILIAHPGHELHAPPGRRVHLGVWPLANVWLGVSAEDQRRADERIPDLLATPAAIRFVSAEPLLGPIDFRQWQHDYGCGCGWGGDSPLDYCNNCGWRGRARGEIGVAKCPDCSELIADFNACPECDGHDGDGMSFGPNSKPALDWIIVGGESGTGAREMEDAWAEGILAQCSAAGTSFFMKQMGGPVKARMRPIPEHLMVREMPAAQAAERGSRL